MHEETFLARQCAVNGLLQEPRSKCRLSLVRHVLFATKSAAVRHQFNSDFVLGDIQDVTDLIAVIPNSLTT